MRRIILNEFANNGYQQEADKGNWLFFRHGQYEDYWIVWFGEFDLNEQNSLYEAFLNEFAGRFPTIKKNTSLIIVSANDTVSVSEILAIENDPYLFKKYFLKYSDEALSDLLELLSDEEGKLKPVEELMILPESFGKLKEETDIEAEPYYLLYKIGHKMPFLPVRVDHKEAISTDLQLPDNMQECLEWCMGLGDGRDQRLSELESFSKEE